MHPLLTIYVSRRVNILSPPISKQGSANSKQTRNTKVFKNKQDDFFISVSFSPIIFLHNDQRQYRDE